MPSFDYTPFWGSDLEVQAATAFANSRFQDAKKFYQMGLDQLNACNGTILSNAIYTKIEKACILPNIVICNLELAKLKDIYNTVTYAELTALKEEWNRIIAIAKQYKLFVISHFSALDEPSAKLVLALDSLPQMLNETDHDFINHYWILLWNRVCKIGSIMNEGVGITEELLIESHDCLTEIFDFKRQHQIGISSKHMLDMYWEMAVICDKLGDFYISQQQYDKAIKFYQNASKHTSYCDMTNPTILHGFKVSARSAFITYYDYIATLEGAIKQRTLQELKQFINFYEQTLDELDDADKLNIQYYRFFAESGLQNNIQACRNAVDFLATLDRATLSEGVEWASDVKPTLAAFVAEQSRISEPAVGNKRKAEEGFFGREFSKKARILSPEISPTSTLFSKQ
jgi:hypothetical protein